MRSLSKILLILIPLVSMFNLVFAQELILAEGFSASYIPHDLRKFMNMRSFKMYSCDGVENDWVKFDDLRLLNVKHWDYAGKIVNGQMIVHESVASEVLDIFMELFNSKVQIDKMQLIDFYDDPHASKVDNNTSCFNISDKCFTHSHPWHAMGLAIDINPREICCLQKHTTSTMQNLTPSTLQNLDRPNSPFISSHDYQSPGDLVDFFDPSLLFNPPIECDHLLDDTSILCEKNLLSDCSPCHQQNATFNDVWNEGLSDDLDLFFPGIRQSPNDFPYTPLSERVIAPNDACCRAFTTRGWVRGASCSNDAGYHHFQKYSDQMNFNDICRDYKRDCSNYYRSSNHSLYPTRVCNFKKYADQPGFFGVLHQSDTKERLNDDSVINYATDISYDSFVNRSGESDAD